MRFEHICAVMLTAALPAMAAESPPADIVKACVDVQIGNDRSAYLNCLNDAMQRRVEHEHGNPQISAPIDTHSPSNQVGTSNDAAARERMGNTFGVSPAPQRPPRVFVSPIAPPKSP